MAGKFDSIRKWSLVRCLTPTAGFAVILFFWIMITHLGLVDELILPTPQSIGSAFIDLVVHHSFYLDMLATIGRVLGGFMISVLIGVPLGFIVGSSKIARSCIGPLVNYLRFIPPSAYLPLSIIWFGLGYSQKMSIIVLGVFPFLTFMTQHECEKVPQALIDTGKIQGLSRIQIIKKIIIPFSLPGVWNALQLMLGAAWAIIIIAELVATNRGIGSMIINSQRFLQTPKVFAGIITIGAIGIFTDILFSKGKKILFPWVSEKYA